MRATIFVNGLVEDYVTLAQWLEADDYLICADGGTRHCAALGLTPAVVVGDLDSAEPQTLAQFAAAGADIERHPPQKDQTDLELALERALRDGADEVLLLGALGGRIDQTLANLHIIARRRWPVPIRIAEGRQLAQVLAGPTQLTLNLPPGSTVSALPFSPTVNGIHYTGLRYPLEDATLHFGSTQGISNEVVTVPATVAIRDGLLLLVTEEMGHTATTLED